MKFAPLTLAFLVSALAISCFGPPKQPTEPVVLIQTNYGDIKVKLYNETPGHRDNFLKLANSGKLDSSIFHRVISSFMIQGGGLNGGQDDVGDPIPAEIVFPQYYHKRGALAAARTGDDINPERKSSGSQFYIVQGRVFDEPTLVKIAERTGVSYTQDHIRAYTTEGGAPHLDGAYTVFGEVIEGMDVVDRIAAVKTVRDKPVTDVTMKLKVLKK